LNEDYGVEYAKSRGGLCFYSFVCGPGALAGGAAAIIDPYNPFGVNADALLRHSPFTDFLIPGLLLFGVIGLGNLFAALAFFRN